MMQQAGSSRSRAVRIVAGLALGVLAAVLVLGAMGRLGTPAGQPAASSESSPTAASTGVVATAPFATPPPPTPGPTLAATTAAPTLAATTPPSASAPATPGPPSTPPSAAAGDVILVAAGDIGRCDSTSDDDTGALAASLPGVVATLGDTAYEDGTTQELEQCFGGSWGAVKDRIRFAITGNHDVHTDNGAPLRAYMGDAASRDGHPYFSEDLGAWHVVVLDGNCGLLGSGCRSQSDQVKWLRDDLAANGARCTLALWHQPRFSSGSHGDDKDVGPLWDALHAAGAELVLNGHDHEYERFAPQDPSGAPDDAQGITEIVAGMGGATLEAFKDPRPNSVVRINDTYGVLKVTLSAESWSLQFVGTDGAVHDQANGTCH
jgi:hypothetical protein